MKTFLINLDRRPDRLESMVSQLNHLGIPFERIAAVDGKSIGNSTDYFSPRRFFLENNRHYVPGEVGCALSHINIWKMMVRDNIEYALVLEDDVILSDHLPPFLASNIFKHFDYLKIDFEINEQGAQLFDKETKESTTCTPPFQYNHLGKDGENYNIYQIHKEGMLTACECDPVPYYTGGYVISLEGAKTFLKVTKRMYYPIDLLPRYAPAQIKEGFVTSTLAKHQAADSDIPYRHFGASFTTMDQILLIPHKLFNRRRVRQAGLFSRR